MTEFFSMGGYGFFIWSSYGMVFFLIIIELVQLRRRQSIILKRLGRMARSTTVEN